jgi:hypothetical protein
VVEALGRALSAGAGEAMVFAGPLRHGGGVVTHGVRTVLVLFLYVEGFAYGGLLGHAAAAAAAAAAAGERGEGGGQEGSSSEGGGSSRQGREFVVYRETLALAQALRVKGEEEEEEEEEQ